MSRAVRLSSLVSFPLCLLLLAACSGSDASTDGADNPAAGATNAGVTSPTATSGSRLRAKYIQSDSARLLVGFYDTQRQEDCTFQPAEAGHTRCLPTNMLVTPSSTTGFADAACMFNAVVAPADDCGSAQYLLNEEVASDACAATPTEIRALLPVSAPLYLVTSGTGGCSPSTAATPANVRLPGDVVPWTEFVDGALTNAASGDLLDVTATSSDGASAHVSYQSSRLGVDCTFRLMADGTPRCVPDGLDGSLLYGDAACSTPSAVQDYRLETDAYPNLCGDPANIWVADGTKGGDGSSVNTIVCSGISAVYTLRALDPSAASTLYVSRTPTADDASTCTLGSASFYAGDGRSIDQDISSTLPSATRVMSGTSRLVPALVPTDDTTPSSLVPGFHDTQRDVDCAFAMATDGKMRCLPIGTSATLFFTDGTCSSPQQVAVLAAGCASTQTNFARVSSTTCPATVAVYSLGGTSDSYASGSVLTDPSRCATVAGIDFAYAATIADPTQFAEGQLVTE